MVKPDDCTGIPHCPAPPTFYPSPHLPAFDPVDCSNQTPRPHASSWVWSAGDPAGDFRVISGCFTPQFPPLSGSSSAGPHPKATTPPAAFCHSSLQVLVTTSYPPSGPLLPSAAGSSPCLSDPAHPCSQSFPQLSSVTCGVCLCFPVGLWPY